MCFSSLCRGEVYPPIYQIMWVLWVLWAPAFRRPGLMEKERPGWGGVGIYPSPEKAAGTVWYGH